MGIKNCVNPANPLGYSWAGPQVLDAQFGAQNLLPPGYYSEYIWGGRTPAGTNVDLPTDNFGYIFQFVNNSPPQQAVLPTGVTTGGNASFKIGVEAASPTNPAQLIAPSGGFFYLPGNPTILDFHQPSETLELFPNGNGLYGIIGGTWPVFNQSNIYYALQTFNLGLSAAFTQNTNSSTLTGTTAGTIVSSMPEQGVAKKFVAYANGYENDSTTAQTITFPTAFSNPPVVTTNTSGLTVTASTTELTINAPDSTTTYTGLIIVEGI